MVKTKAMQASVSLFNTRENMIGLLTFKYKRKFDEFR